MNVIFIGTPIEVVSFLKIWLIEAVYNVMIVIIIYPLIKVLGNLLDDAFTEKRSLMKLY